MKAIPPSSPLTGRLHLALTAALLVGGLSLAGLAVAGRVHFGEPAPVPPESAKESTPAAKAEGRYRIEKLDDVRELFRRARDADLIDGEMADCHAFKYRGGLVEVKLEVDGESSGPVPANWGLLKEDPSLRQDSAAAVDREGYILLATMRPELTLSDAMAPYQVHLGAIQAFAPFGPLHVLGPLHVEASQRRYYRLLVSIGPPNGEEGVSFNLIHKHDFRVRSPLVSLDPAVEEGKLGGGKNLQSGKEELLLDRARGYSRVRLKARFLTDGEVHALLPK